MRYIVITLLLLSSTYIFAQELTSTQALENKNEFIGNSNRDSELAKTMIEAFKTNVALKKINLNNVVFVQGQERNYKRLFYILTNDYFLSVLKQLNLFEIQHHDKTPRLQVIGTPTSLKIKKANNQKMEDFANSVGADGIFLWDIFEYENKMQLLCKIIRVEDHEVLWSFQINEEDITLADKLKKEFKRQYKIPLKSYIVLGASFNISEHTYTKSNGTTSKVERSSALEGFSLLYTTSTLVSPKIQFGILYDYSSLVIKKFNISYHAFLVDVRLQLNEYIHPVYDLETGDIFLNRNRQIYTIGVAFGPLLTTSPNSEDNVASAMARIYFNGGITESLEFNLGILFNSNKTLVMKDDDIFTNNKITSDYMTYYMGIGYKFDIGE